MHCIAFQRHFKRPHHALRGHLEADFFCAFETIYPNPLGLGLPTGLPLYPQKSHACGWLCTVMPIFVTVMLALCNACWDLVLSRAAMLIKHVLCLVLPTDTTWWQRWERHL